MTEPAPAHTERTHADISPSSLKSFETCPGFLNPPRDDNQPVHPVTAEGTVLHEALDEGNLDTLPEDIRDLAQMCEAYASMLPSAGGSIIKEPKLTVAAGVFGYADQLQVTEDEVDLIDWKFGWNQVDAADTNPQGQAYALGAFKLFPKVKRVNVHFVQPRLGYHSTSTYNAEDMPKIELRVRSIIAAVANAKPDDYTIVPENCQYCARYNCPKVATIAQAIAGGYSEGNYKRRLAEAIIKGPDAKRPPEPSLPDPLYPRLLDSPEEVAKALALAPVLEAWATSARRRGAEMRIKEGIEIPGYELAHRSIPKKVRSASVAYEIAAERGISAEEFIAECSVPLGKLTKLYTTTSAPRQKAKDARLLEARLADNDAISEGGEAVPYLKKTKNKITK